MFDSEDWNVDTKAASLDSSLFGPVTPKSNKKKKSKTGVQSSTVKQKINLKRKTFSEEDTDLQVGKKSKKGLTDKSNIPNNDGNKMDKHSKVGQKGKKGDLKKTKQEKRKQKSIKGREISGEQENKVGENISGKKSDESQGNDNKKKKTKRKRKSVDSETSTADKTDEVVKPELGEQKKLSIAEKKRRKRKKEKERKKRKMQNVSENSSPKKAKLNESVSAEKTETGQMSRKERRNKRKKNNSKKNKFANLSLPKKDANLSSVSLPAKENIESQNSGVSNEKSPKLKKVAQNKAKQGTDMSCTNKLNKNDKSETSVKSSKKKRKDKAKKPKNDANNLTKLQDNNSTNTPSKQKFDLTKLKEVLSTSEKKIEVITKELEKRAKTQLDSSESDDEIDTPKKNIKGKKVKNKNTPEKNMKGKKEGMESKGQERSLKERMQDQLNAARFRYLNEQLYTTTGAEAAEMFADDDDAFHVYHQGYQTQVSKWPVDPLNIIIKQIKSRHKSSKAVIADLGCGSARLAENLPGFKVHSFDFVAANERVTACDMSHVPLKAGSVDVVVFCLSLMGTNLVEYILEANRILKPGGMMKVAEVESRFKKVGAFVSKVEKLGFEVVIKDLTNKMFYLFDFKKDGDVKSSASNPKIELDPCIYKKR